MVGESETTTLKRWVIRVGTDEWVGTRIFATGGLVPKLSSARHFSSMSEAAEEAVGLGIWNGAVIVQVQVETTVTVVQEEE